MPYLGFTLALLRRLLQGYFQFGVDWVHLVLIVGALGGRAGGGRLCLQPLLLGDKLVYHHCELMFAVGAALAGIAGMLVACRSRCAQCAIQTCV